MDDVNAIVKVFTKLATFNHGLKVAVSSADETNIDWSLLVATNRKRTSRPMPDCSCVQGN